MENCKDLFLKYLDNNLAGEELKSLLLWMKNPENSKQWEDWIKEDWEEYNSVYNKTDSINKTVDNLKNRLNNDL